MASAIQLGLRHYIAGGFTFGVAVYGGIVFGRTQRQSENGCSPSCTCTERGRLATFDKIAARYDSEVGFSETLLGISGFRRRLIREHATGSVLEVAAGTGPNLGLYSDRCERITLVDFSSEMLEQARKKASVNAERTIECRVMNAGNLEGFKDATFDTVVDTFGLCSFEDPVVVLRELQRVCKPAGQILLLEHGRPAEGSGWFRTWLQDYLDKRALDHALAWGCSWNRDIEGLVAEAGLEVVQKRLHHFGTCYELICRPRAAMTASAVET